MWIPHLSGAMHPSPFLFHHLSASTTQLGAHPSSDQEVEGSVSAVSSTFFCGD